MHSDLNSSNIEIASQNIEGWKGLGTNLSLEGIQITLLIGKIEMKQNKCSHV